MASAQIPPGKGDRLAMLKVLIVDDDANIRNLLELTLREAGFSVMTASSGREGFALATEHSPDVVILDVMMPGMHGYELCRRLRADPRSAHARIIFLTARAQPVDEQAGLDAGADLFLAKPVMHEELIEKIHLLVTQAEALPAREVVPSAEQKEEAVAGPPPPAQGRLICCFSLHPQVGVTTLAVNLSLAFALSRRAATPLIELHPASADVLDALGLEPISYFTPREEMPGWDALAPHLLEHSTGVHVLPAPPVERGVSPTWMKQAVVLLRSQFPLVLADVTSEPGADVQSVLAMADLVLLVMTPDVPAVSSALRAIQGLHKLKVPDPNILLIVNNVRPEADVAIEKIQEGMKRPIFAVIPHTPGMQDAFRSGQPWLVAEPRSPASQVIGRTAMRLARGLRLP